MCFKKNVQEHTGSLPVHSPSLRHSLLIDPSSRYPRRQVYDTLESTVVVVIAMSPLRGSERVGHTTVEGRAKEKGKFLNMLVKILLKLCGMLQSVRT